MDSQDVEQNRRFKNYQNLMAAQARALGPLGNSALHEVEIVSPWLFGQLED